MGKKRKPGRPKLPKGQGKGSVITVRLTKDERKKVGDTADRAGLKVSQWVRKTLLSAAGADSLNVADAEDAGIEPLGARTPDLRM